MRTSRLLPCLAALLALTACHRREDPDAHMRAGDQYMKSSQYKEASVEYRIAEQAAPKRGDVRQKLAEAYMKSGDIVNGARQYIYAADLLPNDVNAQIMAGRVLLAARQFEDAKARAQKAVAIDPKNTDAQILLGNAKANLKDLDGAIADYQDAIALDPNGDQAYTNLGTIQLAKGLPEDAEETFRKAIEMNPKSINARLALANFLWAKKRLPEAEQTLKDALGADAGNLSANSALGMFYLATDRAKEAEPYFRKIAASSSTAAAGLSLADYYAFTQRFAESRQTLQDLIRTNPDAYAAATTRLAALDAGEGQRAQAEKRLRDVLDKAPREEQARLLLARLLLLDDKRDESLTEATKIVAEQATSAPAAQAYLLIGGIQASRDRPEDAAKAYQEAMKLQSQPLAALMGLAALSLRTGNADKAATYAQQAATLQPNNPAVRAMHVRTLLATDDKVHANAEIAALLKDYPKSPTVLNLQAIQFMAENNLTAARASFSKAAQVAPNDLEALTGLIRIDLATGHSADAVSRVEAGMKAGSPTGDFLIVAGRTYASAGQPDKAEAIFKRVIEMQPARLEAYSLLGTLYISQRRMVEAHTQYEKIVKENPKSVPANTMLGMIYEAENRPADAEKQYRTVLSLDSKAAVAANNLAWLDVSAGKSLDEALQLAKQAQQALPDEPHVADTLGWIYVQKDMAATGVPFLEMAVKKDPEDPGNHYHLGIAYSRAGDLNKAREELQKAVASKRPFPGSDDARKVLNSLGRGGSE